MSIGAWILFLVVITIGFAGCGKTDTKDPVSKQPTAEPANTAKSKILYWKSSMIPGYRSDKPGKDPMGMELVPVYAGEAAEGPPGTVAINPRTVQDIGVRTTVVRRAVLSRDVRTVGTIDYDERMVNDVAPKIGGWVERQYVNFEGQMVRKGEPLGTIYSPELVATQQEYLNALRFQGQLKDSPLDDATTGAQNLVESVETRLRYWDISKAQIRALRERGKITRTMVLHAPFTGIVLKKNVFQGGYVKPGQSMYQLADISKVWVYADIYEYEAPWLKPGQQATMTLSYEPGATYHGRIIYIYPFLNQKTRTIRVRMEFRNSRDFKLKPGMWANVNLKPDVSREALVIPVDAVLRTGTKNIAIIALGNGHFAPRDITLGAQAGDHYQVLAGLKAGDRVVDSAEFLINSESSLQSAFSKMTSEPTGKEKKTAPFPGQMHMEHSHGSQHSGDVTPGSAAGARGVTGHD